MESASIADVEARALVDGYLEGGRRVVVDKAIYRAGRDAVAADHEVHDAATVALIPSGMVGALVLVVFVMDGHGHVWWAGPIALAGWPPLFAPRFVREDRRWRKENK